MCDKNCTECGECDIMPEQDDKQYSSKPKKLMLCRTCNKKTMKHIRTDTSFISGDGYYYKCPCGAEDVRIW